MKIIKSAIAVGVLVASGVANAGITFYAENPLEGQNTYHFSEIGVNKKEIDSNPQGMGNDMPLMVALEIVVPTDFELVIEGGADNYPVDWEGEKNWLAIVKEMSVDNDLRTTVDWDKMRITVASEEYERKMVERARQDLELAKRMKSDRDSFKSGTIESEVSEVNFDTEINEIARSKGDYEHLSESSSDNTLKSLKEKYEAAQVRPGMGTFDEYANMVGSKIYTGSEATFVINPKYGLKENLRIWSTSIDNWQFVDNTRSGKDFFYTSPVILRGTFMDVTSELVSKYKDSDFPLDIKFHVEEGNVFTLELVPFNYKLTK